MGVGMTENVIELKAKTSTTSVVVERDEQDRWAARICTAMQKSVEAILETGRLLIQAKAALPHGGFEIMVRDKLPFSKRTAERFIAIAENPQLSKATHASHLPASWTTLYELSRWSSEELALGLKHSAFINPGTKREEVPTLHKRIRSKLGIRVRSKGRADRDAEANRTTRRLEAVKRLCRKLNLEQRVELMRWLAEEYEEVAQGWEQLLAPFERALAAVRRKEPAA